MGLGDDTLPLFFLFCVDEFLDISLQSVSFFLFFFFILFFSLDFFT